MIIARKQKKEEKKESFRHGLYLGRVKGEDKTSRGIQAKLEIEFEGMDKTLLFEIPSEFDEEAHSGHQLAALFGGSVSDDLTVENLVGRTAYFVVVINKTAGGRPKPTIATVLSVETVRNAQATLPEKDVVEEQAQ